VKRRIGYVSPEMHRSYRQNLPAIRVVASGLKDSIGLYVKPNEAERELCRRWMQVFGLQGFDERPFLSLSSGEQRLVLLARAFVKSPDLLILDEPLHGLDDANRQLVKQVIETYCSRRDKTLIMVTHYDDELPPCIDHRLYLKRN
jgi:molybdate transport system ATP-binding protein